MTLNEAVPGERYVVTGIDLPDDVQRRFRTLGLINRTPLRVLNKSGAGAVILAFRGSRFAVGRKFAQGISINETKGGRA